MGNHINSHQNLEKTIFYGILKNAEIEIGRRHMGEEYNDKWINLEGAAEYLSVNKDTIRNWIRKGTEIPAHKIGKLWKFKKSELDEWVKSGNSANL
jgi:excisionase family DNA binding protein